MKSILDIYFHIKDKLENAPELQQAMYYGWLHTKNVFDAVCYLAALEGINDHDTMILKLAAMYHDTGRIDGSENHEYRSAVIAHKDLQSFGFSESDIDQVCRLIVSTMLGNKPVGVLEEIMRDADLEYLGRDYYPSVSEFLRKEKNVEPSIWKGQQIIFMEKHKFITGSAQKLFNRQKEINVRMLKENMEDINRYG